MNIDLLANIIGMIGTFLILVAYMLIQLDKMNPKGLAFNLINLFGALFLLLSLLVHFNLASFVMEIFWVLASLIGLAKIYRRRQNKAVQSTD